MTATISPLATLRQSDLSDLAEVLNAQKARSFDVVAPARSLNFVDDQLVLTGVTEPILFDDGVMDVNGSYSPSSVADEGLAEKVGIPISYLRKCRTGKPALYAQNLNDWLTDDNRNFLLRFLRSTESNQGILRAVLSDQYMKIDNIDVLMAVLQGITEAGVENPIIDADLTERRMIVRVAVPEIGVYAEKFLKDYRNPFDGSDVSRGWTPSRLQEAAKREGHQVDDKVVFAGFVFSNGEDGGAAFRLAPRLVVGPCTNGLQLHAETVRKTHLGAKLEAGMVQWSQETLQANLALITQQTTDTVRTYLDKDYVTAQVEKLTAKASEKVNEPAAVIAAVAKKSGFSEAQQNLILKHFIGGGQNTIGGVMQAITSAAQVVRDGDTAYEMELAAVKAMDYAHDANKELAKV